MKNGRTFKSRLVTLRWILNVCIVILAALGIRLNYAEPNVAKNTALYFTIQSNIWILAICLILCCYDWRHRPVPKIVFVVKYIFTAAITLTGVVYIPTSEKICRYNSLKPLLQKGKFPIPANFNVREYNLILAPQYGIWFGSFWKAYSVSVVLLHLVVPILSVVSFLWLDDAIFSKGLCFAGCTTPLIYFAGIMLLTLSKNSEEMFEGIGGSSTKFPYFFMDYETNGWFTLSSNIGELSVFYWITAGLLLTLGLSSGLLWLKRKTHQLQ